MNYNVKDARETTFSPTGLHLVDLLLGGLVDGGSLEVYVLHLVEEGRDNLTVEGEAKGTRVYRLVLVESLVLLGRLVLVYSHCQDVLLSCNCTLGQQKVLRQSVQQLLLDSLVVVEGSLLCVGEERASVRLMLYKPHRLLRTALDLILSTLERVEEAVELDKVFGGLVEGVELTLSVILGTDEHTNDTVSVLLTGQLDVVDERLVVKHLLRSLVQVTFSLFSLLVSDGVEQFYFTLIPVGVQLVYSLHSLDHYSLEVQLFHPVWLQVALELLEVVDNAGNDLVEHRVPQSSGVVLDGARGSLETKLSIKN